MLGKYSLLAEEFWSPQEKLVWSDFVRRMEARFRYTDAGQVKYARSACDPRNYRCKRCQRFADGIISLTEPIPIIFRPDTTMFSLFDSLYFYTDAAAGDVEAVEQLTQRRVI